ncbi:MAG: GNAT family N-acetyltransferase [Bacteroidetes bacterium]|nr:GNAT family N-acetyltransferase [Bacteroidota bacterium]
MSFIIRKGNKADLPQVLELIKVLAVFEKAPEEVNLTLEQFKSDGEGDRPYYHLFVAEMNNTIVGIALYYYGYSTWKGKMMYLDDLVVLEEHRRKGLGKSLFDALVKEAKEQQAAQIRWHVLDWNEPAIAFYKKINTKLDNEWIKCQFDQEQINAYSFD